MSAIENKGRIPEPEFGQCIVKFEERGKTAGGLFLPTSHDPNRTPHDPGTDMYAELVKTYGKYTVGAGLIVEHNAKPGDMLVLDAQCPMVWEPGMPENMRVVALKNVISTYPGKRREAH